MGCRREEDARLLHAYHPVYPDNLHACPCLWEDEQPYIDRLVLNARTCNRRVVQRYFQSREARANARIWRQRHFLPGLLYEPYLTWER